MYNASDFDRIVLDPQTTGCNISKTIHVSGKAVPFFFSFVPMNGHRAIVHEGHRLPVCVCYTSRFRDALSFYTRIFWKVIDALWTRRKIRTGTDMWFEKLRTLFLIFLVLDFFHFCFPFFFFGFLFCFSLLKNSPFKISVANLRSMF